MKKALILITVLCICLVALVSCADKTEANPTDVQPEEKNVGVETLEEKGEGQPAKEETHFNTINIYVGDELKYTAKYGSSSEMTAFELLQKICDDQKIEYTHLDGYVNGIDGYANAADRGWLYYFNGEMPEVGASDYTIAKGFDNVVDFKYLKYSEAFPEE